MKLLLSVTLLFLAELSNAQASSEGSEFGLELTEFSVEYFRYEGRRDSYLSDHQPTDWIGGSKVSYTLGVLKYFYWFNQLHFEMDNTPQIRSGGWEFEAGIKPFKWLDIYKHHHSQHVFEATNSNGHKFPVEDAYGIRLNLIK